MNTPESAKRILIVEDEGLVAMLLEDMLADLGHLVAGVARDTREARMVLTSQPRPDAAILDVNLDGELSYPIADVLQAQGIPFVFSTGYGRRGIDEGYSNCLVLQKPFSGGELKHALDSILLPSA